MKPHRSGDLRLNGPGPLSSLGPGLPAGSGLPGRTPLGWPGRAPTPAGLLMGCRQQQPRAHPSGGLGKLLLLPVSHQLGLCPGAGAPLIREVTRVVVCPPQRHPQQCCADVGSDTRRCGSTRIGCSVMVRAWPTNTPPWEVGEAELPPPGRHHWRQLSTITCNPLNPPTEKQGGMPVSRSRHPRQAVGACPVSRSRARPRPPQGEKGKRLGN